MTQIRLDIDRLPGLVDAALSALSSTPALVHMHFASREGPFAITMPPYSGSFGSGPTADLLAWERFVDALPNAVELARLAAMHSACEAAPPQPWSVYTTATTLAWLHMASRGPDGQEWEDNVAAILLAAESDGDVRLAAPDKSTMHGFLRSRRLQSDITLSDRVGYRSAASRMIAVDVIPHAAAVASTGRHVGELVGVPWLREVDVRILQASTASTGTAFTLEEPMVPLATIPDAAMSAAPRGGPAYAPWIVTASERTALDEVDAAVHRPARRPPSRSGGAGSAIPRRPPAPERGRPSGRRGEA